MHQAYLVLFYCKRRFDDLQYWLELFAIETEVLIEPARRRLSPRPRSSVSVFVQEQDAPTSAIACAFFMFSISSDNKLNALSNSAISAIPLKMMAGVLLPTIDKSRDV
jgi:hypothetical protein